MRASGSEPVADDEASPSSHVPSPAASFWRRRCIESFALSFPYEDVQLRIHVLEPMLTTPESQHRCRAKRCQTANGRGLESPADLHQLPVTIS